VRRSFHTLKGSGRMVGARELAEFAWAIENLLNRVLDNTLTRSPPILEMLRAAIAALPELVEQLAGGPPPHSDTGAIVARAHALAVGRSTPAAGANGGGTATVEMPPLRPSAADAARAAQTGARAMPGGLMDDEPEPAPGAELALSGTRPGLQDDTLREIYARETTTHIAAVRAYLTREATLPEPHALPEEVYRACHTLSGSSKMAQARHGIRLAEPLDHWLRRVYGSGLGLRTEELALLGDSMAAMHSVATHLDEPTGYFVNHWALLERIEKAKNFNQGFKTVEYLASAIYDLKIHTLDHAVDPGDFEKRTMTEIGCPKEIVMRHRPTQFGHIFSGDEYSAGYYVYLWADTLTADAAEAFEKAGSFYDKPTAKKLHDCIMSVGNSIPPEEAFRRFRGRDVDTNAIMRDRGFPVTT